MLHIQVVGPGCANCQRLVALCQEAVAEMDVEARIEKVTDVTQFASLGVLLTPGLLVNGKLLSSGKIPTPQTVRRWIQDAAGIIP